MMLLSLEKTCLVMWCQTNSTFTVLIQAPPFGSALYVWSACIPEALSKKSKFILVTVEKVLL